MESVCPGSFLDRLNHAQEVLVVCPTYIGPQDLRFLHLLLMNSCQLRSLAIDRIQLGDEAGKFFECLPQTLRNVSLQQTFVTSGAVHSLLRVHGYRLESIDFSYTNIDDTSLQDVARFCNGGNLKELYLNATFRITGFGLEELLARSGPTSLKKLALKHAHMLRSQWLLTYFVRQERAQGRVEIDSLWLDGCDMLTLRDIRSLVAITKSNCWISHSAILEDDTIEGYMDLIHRIARGIINTPSSP